jgi:hypothetical protein
MKKHIYYNKIKNKYLTKDNTKTSIERKCLLALKSLGLIFILLLGPSILVSLLASNYQNYSLLKRTIILFIVDLIILGIFIIIYWKNLKKDFKNFFNENILQNIELSFKYWLAGFLVMVTSNLIISMITNGSIASNEDSVRQLIKIAPLYMLFDVSIYAPITEELIFRKSFRDVISNKWIYILVSGIVFGSLHVITSITNITDLLFLIPYCALGISFASLYYKSNNIFSSICMHAMHNTMCFILLFVYL